MEPLQKIPTQEDGLLQRSKLQDSVGGDNHGYQSLAILRLVTRNGTTKGTFIHPGNFMAKVGLLIAEMFTGSTIALGKYNAN